MNVVFSKQTAAATTSQSDNNNSVMEQVEHRGISSGDFLLGFPRAAYTTMRTVAQGTRIFQWEIHLQRLRDTLLQASATGSSAIAVSTGAEPGNEDSAVEVDRGKLLALQLRQDILQLVQACLHVQPRDSVGDAPRSDGGQDWKFTVVVELDRVLVHCAPFQEVHANWNPHNPTVQGVTVELLGTPRTDPNAKNTHWVRERTQQLQKHLPDTHEWILHHPTTHQLYEGTSCNFFTVQQGAVHTASLDAVLPGTMQRLVHKVCAREQIPWVYAHPSCQDVQQWQGAFLTSTSRVVVPVAAVLCCDQTTLVHIPKCPLTERISQLVHLELLSESTEITPQ